MGALVRPSGAGVRAGPARLARARRGPPRAASSAAAAATVPRTASAGKARTAKNVLGQPVAVPSYDASGSSGNVVVLADGDGGPECAQWVGAELGALCAAELGKSADSGAALARAFAAADEYCVNYQPPGPLGMFAARGLGGARCSAAATVAVLAESSVTVANVGDVRALVVKPDGSFEEVSAVHTADDEAEVKRIVEATVDTLERLDDNARKIARNRPEEYFSYPGSKYDVPVPGFTWCIAAAASSQPIGSKLTRAFGNAFLKGTKATPSGYGIMAVPSVTDVALSPGDVLVLATCGVFEGATPSDVAAACAGATDPQAAADAVLSKCPAELKDDATITVIVA